MAATIIRRDGGDGKVDIIDEKKSKILTLLTSRSPYTATYEPTEFQEESIRIMVNAASPYLLLNPLFLHDRTKVIVPADKEKGIKEVREIVERNVVDVTAHSTTPFGRILADEMGLGKTSQMLETIRRLESIRLEKEPWTAIDPSTLMKPMSWSKNNLRYLVLAPKSMIRDWRKEAYMICPEFGKRVHICDEKLGNSKNVPCQNSIVLVTTADLLRTAGWKFLEEEGIVAVNT